jgi:hypothetical protein
MMKSSRLHVALFVSAAVVSGLAVATWFDTSPYFAAEDALARSASSSLADVSKALIADHDRLSACNQLNTIDPAKQDYLYTANSRACFLDAMPRTRTATGALISSAFAESWLRHSPDDEELRTAALTAIARGRDDLLKSKAQWYDLQDKLAEAHDRSIMLKLRDGAQSNRSAFDDVADRLNQAEFAVLRPDVSAAQTQWLTRAHCGTDRSGLCGTATDISAPTAKQASLASAITR